MRKKIWLCLWRDAAGQYVVNEDYEFLSMQTTHKGSLMIERKMREAATGLGILGGRPVWRIGRQITQTQWEVQMERMLDGQIPDEVDAYYAAIGEEEE